MKCVYSLSIGLNSENKSYLWLILGDGFGNERVGNGSSQSEEARLDLCTTLFLIAATIVPSLV